ncbi:MULTISPECIES: MOSC domain-containing protein [Kocuria]|uniref:MOSC domain-containing protein n=1 Tax=Kocuria TaxID=57493 RepID=UPI000DB23207|nr:MOSC domain-containing protein [Kocuria carniphila]MCT1803142.1 MOSC domain-containing protein [Kocuria carniphila]PZP34173.1 MAG: MOSC domain-containing protein [Kocuria rhizophila]
MSQDQATVDEPKVTDASITLLRTGEVKSHNWGSSRALRTAAVKTPHAGPVHLTATGFVGDEQGNLKHHGGTEKAVCCYPAEHYDAWRAEGLELPDGAFFENLTIRGATEDKVFLGDVYRVGSAVVQVTQPRQPCGTISKKWSNPDLPKLMMSTNRCGYYLRVLEVGDVQVGDRFEFVSRLPDAVSSAFVSRIMNVERGDLAAMRELLEAPEFPDRWRKQLRRRLGESV